MVRKGAVARKPETLKIVFAGLLMLSLVAVFLADGTAWAQEEFEFGLGDIGFDPVEYKAALRDYSAPPYFDKAPTDPAFDWRDYGIVTPAKNQGSCGSCWAFACVGVLESKIILNGGPTYDLSEQQQVSCNLRYDPSAGGCCGGNYYAFDFWCANGPMEESCTGYGDGSTGCPTNRNVTCGSLGCSELAYHLTDKFTVDTSDVTAVKTSLDQDGPAYFRFTVYSDFYTYWSTGSPGDVYTQTSGSVAGGHAVLIIGWDDSKSAWLLKNSWGTTGGPHGDGTFWMAWSGHANSLGFGMANADLVQSGDCMECPTRTLGTPGSTYDLKISGSYAYAADYSAGLQIIDISNPLSPELAGSVDTPDYARAVDIAGSYAYIADSTSGLQVIDITNPSAPSIVGSVDTPDSARGVTISGSYAYVADYTSGLQVIDISTPSAPVIVGSVDTPSYAFRVDISGSYAYVADYMSGLQVIDISDPFAPSITGTVNTPGYAWGIDVSGSYAYIADYSSGLQIIDISNPSAPIIIGSVDTPGYTYAVATYGSYAYAADGSEGLQIIDVSTPTAPAIISSVDTFSTARNVEASGSYIYVADYYFTVVNPCVDCIQFYPDNDGDGYGSGSGQCYFGPYGAYTTALGGDCDDADGAVNPGQTETTCNGTDDDCDAGTLDDPNVDGDPVSFCDGDCDDDDAANYPGNAETCDGQDNDCNTLVDDDDPGCTGQPTWYEDFDGDTYGNAAVPLPQCTQPAGYVADNTDCDDNDANNYPGNTEVCDGQDNDCDTLVDDDDGDCTGQPTWYEDFDGDTYGNPAVSMAKCIQPGGYVADNTDCDDNDGDVNPGESEITCNGTDDDCDAGTLDNPPDNDGDLVTICAGDCDDNDANNYPGNTEVCDGQDNDCDTLVDDDDPGCTGQPTWYEDFDGDTYGNAAVSLVQCSQPAGYVADNTDCDDADAANYPGNTEICDGQDNDCDTLVDDNDPDCSVPTWYEDFDGDTYGNAAVSLTQCAQPAGYVADNTDCDDGDTDVNPGAIEICDDLIDNECDGFTDGDDPDCGSRTCQFLQWVPDYGGTTAPELARAGINYGNNRVMAQVKDASTDAQLQQVFFTLNFEPICLAVLPDFTGTSAPELATLGRRESDGCNLADVRDASSDALLKRVYFHAEFLPYDMEWMPDFGLTSAPELVTLARRSSDTAIMGAKRDASSRFLVNPRTWFIATFLPVDIEVMVDIDGNGVDELVSLQQRASDDEIISEVRDASSNTLVQRVWYDNSYYYQPLDVEVVSDFGGDTTAPELAMLRRRPDTGTVAAEVRDASTGTLICTVGFSSAYMPLDLEVVPDFGGGSTAPELVMLGYRESDHAVIGQMKDASSDAFIGTVSFDSDYRPKGIEVLPSFGETSAPELAVHGVNPLDGSVIGEVKDASSGAAVSTCTFSKYFVIP